MEKMMKNREIVSKAAYYCFYIGVIIEVLLVLIDKSAYINPMEGRAFQITFLLFFIKVCLTKYTPREYIAIFLFAALGIVSYFVTGRNEIVRVVMFITACKDIDIKRCLKVVFYVTLTGCAAIMLLSVTGIYGAVSLTQEFDLSGIKTRYTLGMGHPNALQCMLWALTTLGMYIYAERMKWYHYLIVLMGNAFFFLLTESKTSLLVTVLAIVLTYLMVNKKSEKLARISAASGIFLTAASILGSVIIAGNAYRVYDYIWYGDGRPITVFFVRLSDLLTGRILVLVETATFEGTMQTWRLFSRPENNRFFDMGWIRLFYWYGIIPASLFIIVVLWVMYYCYKKKHYLVIMLMTSFAVYSIIEAHAISVYIARNYMFFIIGQYWCEILEKTNFPVLRGRLKCKKK